MILQQQYLPRPLMTLGLINILRSSVAVWRQEFESTSPQEMAWRHAGANLFTYATCHLEHGEQASVKNISKFTHYY